MAGEIAMNLLLFVGACLVAAASARSFVTTTTTESSPAAKAVASSDAPPRIYSLHVVSRIESRFATTLVTSQIANPRPTDAEATFVVQLPDPAFISNFSMKINDKVIVGEVKEKEEAKKDYDAAKNRGESAGHVSQNLRETNTFTISVNVAKESKVKMELTYQEILKRTHGAYKHIVNINPGQAVDDLKVDVHVYEKTEITRLLAPDFGAKVGEMTNKDLLQLPPSKEVQITSEISSDSSHVHFAYQPSKEQQGTDGLKGQMVVLYDVKRTTDGGELMVVNGYFLHFFAPEGLPVASKHVIFVLDKSGSMLGRKIEQTKEAMEVILRDLNEGDYFNIISFSNSVNFWRNSSVLVRNDTIEEAIRFVKRIDASGGTNINEAMVQALAQTSASNAPKTLTPTVIFMTDGQATVGESNGDTIIKNVLEANVEGDTLVHSIGFGNDVDFKLLKGVSLRNHGVARKVYEDSDSAIQLAGFYSEISSPLLKNVKISYLNETADPESLDLEDKYTAFSGGEVVVIGKLADSVYPTFTRGDNMSTSDDEQTMTADITAEGPSGLMHMRTTCIIPPPCWRPHWPCPPWPPVPMPTTTPTPVLAAHTVGGFVERMWAYQTIKKILEKEKYLEDDEDNKKRLKEQALQLSLKYNFVTEVTSMVVIQPNQTKNTLTLDGKEKKEKEDRVGLASFAGSRGPMGRGGFLSSIAGMPAPVGMPRFPPRFPLFLATTRLFTTTRRFTTTTTTSTTTRPPSVCDAKANAVSVACSSVSRSSSDWLATRIAHGIDINVVLDCQTTPIVCGCRAGFVFVVDPTMTAVDALAGGECRPLAGASRDNNERLAGPCVGECEPTCADRAPVCAAVCTRHSHAYVCKAGLLRKTASGFCVPEDKC